MKTIVEYLDSLNADTEQLELSNKRLTYISNIDKFYNWKELCCYNNNLYELPLLPKKLKYVKYERSDINKRNYIIKMNLFI